ncbi:MAG: M20/M25/M40 family metallo-hydrolase [Actinomycetota bacterium]|nr:M20/M25/M40 family metallo-hydrolase [Actinomycetota bacterium]
MAANRTEVLGLTRRLIRYRSYTPGEAESTIDFINGWFEARGLETARYKGAGPHGELSSLVVRIGSGRPRILLHGHVDVVPGDEEQFEALERDGELFGRGVYDMKGALAAMMYAVEDLHVTGCDATVELLIVPDEEREYGGTKGAEVLIQNGHTGDFLITGEPTDFHIGLQAKGVLDLRVTVRGKSAHGSRPWLGKNAVLLAYEHYKRVLELPFAKERSELFPYPSINMARIVGGDVINRVPDRCTYDLDIRYLPEQDPKEITRQIRSIELPAEARVLFTHEPTYVSRNSPFVKTLREVAARHFHGNPDGVGRHGASDIVFFQRAGVPGVEFGPVGGGHHGPREFVVADSLETYRQMLVQFVQILAANGAGDGEAC